VRLGRTGGRYYSPPSVCRRRVLRLGRQLAYSVHPSSRQTGDRRFADPFSQGGDRPGAWGVVYFVSGGFRKRGGLHCVWQVVACARYQNFFFFFFFFLLLLSAVFATFSIAEAYVSMQTRFEGAFSGWFRVSAYAREIRWHTRRRACIYVRHYFLCFYFCVLRTVQRVCVRPRSKDKLASFRRF